MKRFCVREMRREYMGVTRLYTGTAIIFLLLFAFLSVGMRVRQVDVRYRMLLIALDVFALLTFLGLHLILTDEKRLLRKTPFGQSLSALGKPEEIMRQIDESALKRFERFASFALLNDWLILFYQNGWKYDVKRVCALPVRGASIRAAELLPERFPYDPEKRRVRLIYGENESCDFCLYSRQEWDALGGWLREQEKMTV